MKHILLIEDDETVAEAMVKILHLSFGDDFSVDKADYYESAINMVNSNIDNYFAIISDLVIPSYTMYDRNASAASGFDIGIHVGSIAEKKIHFVFWSAFLSIEKFENFMAKMSPTHVQFHCWPKLQTLSSIGEKLSALD